MRFADYVSMALRSLRRARVRSLLTIFAIVIGATGITVMLTFVTTMKNFAIATFVKTGEIRQIQVSEQANLSYNPTGSTNHGPPGATGTTTELSPTLEAKIANLPHVTGVSASIQGAGPGMHQSITHVSYNGHQLIAEHIVGYEPNGILKYPMLAGRALNSTDTSNEVLISKTYADAFGFSKNYTKLIGSTIELGMRKGYTGVGVTLPTTLPPQQQCPQNSQNCFGGPTSGLPALNLPAKVVGVWDDSNDSNQGDVIMPMSRLIGIFNEAQPARGQYAQRPNCNNPGGPCPPPGGNSVVTGGWIHPSASSFIDQAGGYGSLMVEADAMANVATVAAAIDRMKVSASTGLAALNKEKTAANQIGLGLGALGFIALFIAALGVINTMVMSVLQRTREIGVMRALGARRKTIRRLFTIEATTLGFFGGLFGVTFGYVFLLIATPIIKSQMGSGIPAGTNLSIPPYLILAVIAGTSAIGFLSGYLPARRAAKLDPVEALRYE